MKKINLLFIICIASLLLTTHYYNLADKKRLEVENTGNIEVLLIFDEAFGANYIGIINQFNLFDWTITTAGPTSVVSGCQYNTVDFEVDLLYSEITDITSYDCVNIMPGRSHANLLANQDNILNEIKNADDANVVISAWCRAVRVLAAADVINGENITGHSDYSAEYIAAGANFYSNEPPIISNNIVTVSATQAYLNEMYLAIAQAVGSYEANAPILVGHSVKMFDNFTRLLTVELSDESTIIEVKAIFNIIITDTENTLPSSFTVYLTNSDQSDNFTALISKDNTGSYSVDLQVKDVYGNIGDYFNITTIDVGPTANLSMKIFSIISLFCATGVLIIRRRKINS